MSILFKLSYKRDVILIKIPVGWYVELDLSFQNLYEKGPQTAEIPLKKKCRMWELARSDTKIY